MKLLAPAGNFDILKTAVYNGADEVYVGINQFNARNNIDGFTLDSLKEAVDFAHVFNVKVLLAVNILFDNEEVQSALDLIVDAFNLGVDAFIIQDIGLISILYNNYPEIPVHASTQMGIHNLEGVKEVEKLGVKRVVLARETPLSEIKRIKDNSNIEIEYFVQGALCVSFSGNCYLSSYLFNASGNRGVCKQLCRLPFTLYKGDKKLKKGYLLSAKDFNMINRLKSLKEAGVDVLKIEGRARRQAYVGIVVREYRKALDGAKYSNDNISLAFNRNFTAGYFNGNSGIISNIQNHIGLEIGRVEKINFGKKFNEIIISSNRELHKKSTLKFFDNQTEICTLTAYDVKNIGLNKYLITSTASVNVGNIVRIIVDDVLENEIIKYKTKKDINLLIDFAVGDRARACYCDSDGGFEVLGDILQEAKSQPISKDDVIKSFDKNDFFTPKIYFDRFESVFISKQNLNNLRRDFYHKLLDYLTSKYRKNLTKITLNNTQAPHILADFEYVDKISDNYKSKNVIYSPETYFIDDINNFILSCKNQAKTPFLDLPNFALEEDIKKLRKIVELTKINVIANNLYSLNFDTNMVIGPALNVFNDYSANYFNKEVISAESNSFAMINYPFMTLRHCPIKEHIGGDCNNCKYSNDLVYKTDDGKSLKLTRKKLSTCTFYLK